LLDADSAPLLCDALRANATLTSLELGSSMWHDAAISAALLGALTAHPSIRKLACSSWYPEEDFGDAGGMIVGAALGVLVAANAPALQSLSLIDSRLDGAGVGPLLDALPSNTHLTELVLWGNDTMTKDWVRDQLLPAVRANVGLRRLVLVGRTHGVGEEASALVAARGAAANAAAP
jgi:hypothetical protein